MANDLNLCQFIGRCGQDPELRYTASGDAVVNISIAVNKSWKNKSGQKDERTTWVNIVAFRQLAEIMGKYLHKGSMIYVAGELSVRRWEKDGQTRYSTEIIANQMQMLGGDKDRGAHQGSQEQPAQDSDFYDDDLAF